MCIEEERIPSLFIYEIFLTLYILHLHILYIFFFKSKDCILSYGLSIFNSIYYITTQKKKEEGRKKAKRRKCLSMKNYEERKLRGISEAEATDHIY